MSLRPGVQNYCVLNVLISDVVAAAVEVHASVDHRNQRSRYRSDGE